MEEAQQGSPPAEDWSTKTGEALHVLRAKLATRQEPDGRTATESQADIIARIFQIAEEMAAEQSTEAQATALLNEERVAKLQDSLTERDDAISQLQAQLANLELEKTSLHDELESERAEAEELRARECSKCSELRENLISFEDRAVKAESLVDQLKQEAEESSREIAELQSWRESAASQDEQCARLREEAKQAEQRCGELSEEVATLASERDSLTEELSTVCSDLEQQLTNAASTESDLRAELEAALEQITAAQEHETNIQQERDALVAELAEAMATIDRVKEEAAGLESRCQNEFSEERQKLESAEEELKNLQQQRDSLAEELTEVQANVALLQNEKDSESDRLTRELAEAKELAERTQSEFQALSTEQEKLSAELESLREELSGKESQSTAETAEWESEYAAVKEQLSQTVAEKQQLEISREELSQLLDEANSKVEQSAGRLEEVEKQLRELPDQREQADELEKSERKFELVQADVQKLKRENAALQEELASRPEVSDQESPEMVSLRLERDALAARVVELEEMPAQVVDEDAEQSMADLRRRFELAVDDLRQVKQEKAQLEERLANASHGAAPQVDSGAMDWQSQKARLLASLDSDETDDEPTPERAQEKLTIQGTIDITDQVVADKDREIAELQDQLANRAEETCQDPIADVCDKDELIQAERAKLEQLQAEWREKLRGAELEMCTQRAALARKEAELKEMMAAAEEAAADISRTSDGKPRRRWLSALGLGDEETTQE
ncbi:hypothetical protein [Bythopirellula polymerisocia]|uniref:Chromosome partition protein Smc n=1 Tax=Bythopirellula polymerisocia TaxID=2528003 RepID=A0A5C6CZY3_9BACT|nr:hypothetical protein [Bythopirellula polymerisocia]TWU28229.1 Chromosome partition protein Smc [Bythopirellula polymerisocia]